MNLASCGKCGIVYDKQRIESPNIYVDGPYSEIDTSKASWDGNDYNALINCPSCGFKIFYETGEYFK